MEEICRYFLPDIRKSVNGKGYCAYPQLSHILNPGLWIKCALHPQVNQLTDAVSPLLVSIGACTSAKHCSRYAPRKTSSHM